MLLLAGLVGLAPAVAATDEPLEGTAVLLCVTVDTRPAVHPETRRMTTTNVR
jgi:hypothetical protein